LAVGGIGAGEHRVVMSLSVSIRRVRGMSERRFRCTSGGVCSLGLPVVCGARSIGAGSLAGG
jgi:hypothetical protein